MTAFLWLQRETWGPPPRAEQRGAWSQEALSAPELCWDCPYRQTHPGWQRSASRRSSSPRSPQGRRHRHPARAGRGRLTRPLAMFPGPGETRRRRRRGCQGPRPPKVNPGGLRARTGNAGIPGRGGERGGDECGRAELARAVSAGWGKHLNRPALSSSMGCPENPGCRPALVRSRSARRGRGSRAARVLGAALLGSLVKLPLCPGEVWCKDKCWQQQAASESLSELWGRIYIRGSAGTLKRLSKLGLG